MRTIPALMQSILDSGVYIGENRPSARATVEPDWWLNLAATGTGNWPADKLPLRWFQNAADDQYELEIPNVMMIDIDTSIDNAAAAATISVLNQKMRSNVSFEPKIPDELGQRGYFSFSRGDSAEANARWGQVPNDWNHVLVPNALLRTFEGLGGHTKPLAQAIADGNVMLTGLWLVDDVTIGVGGKLDLKCRDMMKLLIEQQLFPPLVPLSLYPLSYARFYYNNIALHAHGIDVSTVTTIAPGDRQATLSDSSVDHWYPGGGIGSGSPGDAIPDGGFSIHGHKAGDALDHSDDTYFLGEGNSGSDKPFAVNFIEVDCGGEAVNAVFINPWAGNYTAYFSVMENGVWQGDNVVPYDPSVLFGTQPYAVDTGAAIPYVSSEGVPWEQAREYLLPRVYAAQKVRVSFRDLTDSGIGPWRFRAGVRELAVRIGAGGAQTGTVQHIAPIFYAGTAILDVTDPSTTGYITGSQFGQLDAFGDARLYDFTGGDVASNTQIAGIAFTKTRKGYYVLQVDGRIQCYGDAAFHGSPYTDGVPAETLNAFADVLLTVSGLGYWVTRWDGTIRSYGDAPVYAPVVPPSQQIVARACANPNANGLFLITSTGVVHVRGTAVSYGNWSGVALSILSDEFASDIQCTSSGLGYWILTAAGRVQAHGDATDYGGLTTPAPSSSNYERVFALMAAPDDLGYLIMRGDGSVYPIGTVMLFGGPVSGTAQLRSDGNYRDLSDVVKDLVLWSGFFLKETLAPNQAPSVFGAIESTGTYLNDPIPTDLFDKHPVIDAINVIKDIVGYIVGCSWDGGVFFKSPNIWTAGNFDDDGSHNDIIPEIDENVDLTQYGIRATDRPVRSEILISSTKIDPKDSHAQYVRYIPATAKLLRGMVKPAMWVDAHFLDPKESQIMAELIALRIWFQVRTGSVTAWNNPSVGIDDQIRILERETSDSYTYYISGKHTVNDVQQGTWIAQYTTSWLGDRDHWVITAEELQADDGLGHFQISDNLQQWLNNRIANQYLDIGRLVDRRTLSQPVTLQALPDYTDYGNQAGPP